MTKCSVFEGILQVPKSRRLRVDFAGGDISGDGGLLLLGGMDRKQGLIGSVAGIVARYDPRDPSRVAHGVRPMVAQRILGIACGHEDLNDHAGRSCDPALNLVLADRIHITNRDIEITRRNTKNNLKFKISNSSFSPL